MREVASWRTFYYFLGYPPRHYSCPGFCLCFVVDALNRIHRHASRHDFLRIGGPLNSLEDGVRSRALCLYLHRNPFRVVRDCVACRAPLG